MSSLSVGFFSPKNVFRSLSRLRDLRGKIESNHILSSVRIVTSLVDIHSLAIVRKTLVKFKQALLTSSSKPEVTSGALEG
jgi:hypothetical protein